MWVVSDRRAAQKAVMLTAETAGAVFREKMLPELAGLGLASGIAFSRTES